MFLAVTPPPEVIDVISDLPTRALRGVRYTRRTQWHITLRFLGDVQRHHALAALEQVVDTAKTVTVGPEVTLLGNRVVILPAIGLDDLAATVNTCFADVGEPVERDYRGHLTLARLKGRPLRDPSLVSVLGAPLSATFVSDTVELWKSSTSESGSAYTLVASQELS